MKSFLGACLLVLTGGLVQAAQSKTVAIAGDANRGASVYANNCGACHSLDANRVGPAHRGVFGRKAGMAAGYAYSPTLKKLRVVWNAKTLDRWLINPPAMAPGTRMGFRLTDAQRRADVIAYLRRESGKR